MPEHLERTNQIRWGNLLTPGYNDFSHLTWLGQGHSTTPIFDAAHGFRGCIPGIHEVLRREGLLENLVTLDEHETLSPGQAEEIDRVYRAYPHLNDDTFVAAHRDEWLRA